MTPNWKQSELLKPAQDSDRQSVPIDRPTSHPVPRRLLSFWWQLGHRIVDLFTPTREPIIKERIDRYGHTSWRIYDPLTNQTVTLDSQKEVLVWLDERYYSRHRTDTTSRWH
jgi:hypothetical protein